MGISIEAWRQRIGTFSHYGTVNHGTLHPHGHVSQARVTLSLACIFAVLLLISGVESNSGRVMLEDIVRRLDDMLHELRDTRVSLTTKIDESVRNINVRLHQCENLAKANSDCLGTVEQAQAAVGTQLATSLGKNAVSTGAAPASTSTTPLACHGGCFT